MTAKLFHRMFSNDNRSIADAVCPIFRSLIFTGERIIQLSDLLHRFDETFQKENIEMVNRQAQRLVR